MLSSSIFASKFPLTVLDAADRSVTLKHEPTKIVIQDGRDILAFALLDRDNPFKRIVLWNNILKKNDPSSWATIVKKWPVGNDIPDMNFNDDGQVNLEELIAKMPDLLIAQLRSKTVLQQSGVFDKLSRLNIPIVFVDTEVDPVKNSIKSIALLGKILNREEESAQYINFYNTHLESLEKTIRKQKNHPSVFVEALAGKAGLDSCCFTHGNKGWGKLVEAAGGVNVGSKLLPGATGTVSVEKLLAIQPDIYVMTSSQWTSKGSASIPYGYGANEKKIDTAFSNLLNRTGFSSLNAFKKDKIYGIYHQFYNHPYNIVALEYLAKDFYPESFTTLNPEKTYSEIIARFTQIPVIIGNSGICVNLAMISLYVFSGFRVVNDSG